GDRHGAIAPAKLVDETVLFRLPSRPDATLRQGIDALGRAVPGIGDLFDEVVVEGLQLLLQLLQLLRVVGSRRGVDFGVLADARRIDARAQLFVDAAGDELPPENA